MIELPPPARPIQSSPPEGTVGIVLPVKDDLRFFKLAFHSIITFSDRRFMLTLVDNMSGVLARTYIESIRKNHFLNVLQYQKDHNLSAEFNLGLRFMFSYATVKYGVVITPTVIVNPQWLTSLVASIDGSERSVPVLPATNDKTRVSVMGFRRDLYERLNGFDENYDPFCDFAERGGEPIRSDAYVHKFKVNGFDPRTVERQVQEIQEAAI